MLFIFGLFDMYTDNHLPARNRSQNHSVSGEKSQMRTSTSDKDGATANEGESRIKPRSR